MVVIFLFLQFPGPSEAGLTWMKERSAEIPDGIAIFWMGPFYPAVNVFLPETAKIILKTSGHSDQICV